MRVYCFLVIHAGRVWKARPLREWLTKRPRIRLHEAPLAPPNGPQWTELAEHWLKVIAAWPMQASLVESVKRMTEILKTSPPDRAGPTRDHLSELPQCLNEEAEVSCPARRHYT